MRYQSPLFKFGFIFCLLLGLIPSSILLGQDNSDKTNRATPQWVVSTDFVSQSRGSSLVVDSFGNSYSTGYFSDKVWLEDSLYVEGCGNIPFSSNNHFLSKRDQHGTLLWIRYGIGSTRTCKLLLDSLGNVYTIGQVWSSALQFSSIEDSIISKNKSYLHTNQSSIFICQYNSAGKVLRAKILPAQKGQVPNDAVLDTKGNFLIGGYYNYRSPDAPRVVKSSYSLIKLNASWDILWTKEGDKTVGQSQITAVAIDQWSNIYVTGGFVKSILFSKAPLKGHHNGNRSFVVRYNPNGEVQWVLDSLVSMPTSFGMDITCDRAQNIYVLIHTQHSKSFLIKLNAHRQQAWSKTIEGRQTINGLLINAQNNIYLFGNGYTGNFGTAKEHSYQDDGSYRFFIAKYNNYGTLVALNIEGQSGLNYCQGIALFKDKIIALGTSNAGRKLYFGSYSKKVAWYYNIWLATFNQADLNIKSQD
jgi:hypothetical protein